MARIRSANLERAHQASVVVAIHTCELDRQIVVVGHDSVARDVSPEHRRTPGVHDELVARIVTVTAKDHRLHLRQHVAVEHPGLRHLLRHHERPIRERRGTVHVLDLGRRFHHPQPVHDVRGVFELAEPFQGRIDPLCVPPGQPVRLVLHSELPSPAVVLIEYRLQILGRIRIRRIDPHSDVLDHRGVRRDPHVRCTREQRHRADGAEVETLEEHVAEGVVAAEVVHRLLAKAQQPLEALRGESLDGAPPPFGKLVFGEVDDRWITGHAACLQLRDPERRVGSGKVACPKSPLARWSTSTVCGWIRVQPTHLHSFRYSSRNADRWVVLPILSPGAYRTRAQTPRGRWRPCGRWECSRYRDRSRSMGPRLDGGVELLRYRVRARDERRPLTLPILSVTRAPASFGTHRLPAARQPAEQCIR